MQIRMAKAFKIVLEIYFTFQIRFFKMILFLMLINNLTDCINRTLNTSEVNNVTELH